MNGDPIKASRREHLRPWERLVLHYLPTRIYRQVLREYDIAKADRAS